MNMIRAIVVLVIWVFAFFSCIRIYWLRDKERDLREAILLMSVIWGILVLGITEILSLFNQLTPIGIAVLWGVSILCIIGIGVKINRLPLHSIYSPSYLIPPNLSFKNYKSLIILSPYFFLMVVTLGLIAFIAAPNNWDSMTYHLSRVMHWQQNKSVRFYPTYNLRQLHMSPWAEIAILHLQVLVGSDRLANFVQYFAMIGSVIGVSYIAKLLGGDIKAQLFSSLAVITIPMGILQSTSTQNDYVVGFWMICFVSFSLVLMKTKPNLILYLLIGASLGLAIITKATAIIYAAPFIFWIGWVLIKRLKTNVWRPALIISGMILLLNSGHFARNYHLYGSPLGPESESGSSAYSYKNDVYNISSFASNLVRNVGLHLGIPIGRLNKIIEKTIYKFHPYLGIPIDDHRTTWTNTKFSVSYSRHEDLAGNPLHLILFLISLFLLFSFKSIRSVESVIYVICVVISFFIFCFLLKWQPWHSRLHLSFFILAMPITGIVLSRFNRYGVIYFLMLALVVSSIPYVINNKSRPLIGKNSILLKDRISQYFNNSPGREPPYRLAMDFCKKYDCNQIGLICGSDNWEYPLWVLGDLSRSGGRLEHIGVGNISGNLISIFEPDAIIVTYPNQEKEKIFQGKTYTRIFEMNPVSLFILSSKLFDKP